ncbi:MAG: hypothetical protein WDA47_03130 [Bacilli bacterium]
MTDERKEIVTNGEVKDEALEQAEMPLISIPAKELSIEQQVERLEKNIELFNKIKTVSLKLTKEKDWVLQKEDSPYLMDRGAENIAIAWGIDISGVDLKMEWAEDEKGRYYIFTATGKAYAKKLGRYVEDIGVCSQRDKFFGMAGGTLKEIEDVDMANIKRKAVTNLYNRLIKRVVGLMNVTVDDLVAAGLDVKKIPKIDYKKGSQKVAKTFTPAYQEKLQKIRDIANRLAQGNEEIARKAIKEASYFKLKDGKEVFAENVSQLTTEKWIDITLNRIEEMEKKERNPGEEG